ncbi:MAG: hypothetical protein KGK33_02150 [Hyphomicrobiales bacterium]|nr:hypothetical protein [Hyphomicrobiales bacterium]MDE1973761.1 hypothetical protein [Hyphomicrobiales bacterium]MDE2283401.1 hypothetical protein [Hyphomicrobiales bacterium]
MQHAANFVGATFRRSEPGYDETPRVTCRNARLPDWFPEVIVQANDEAQVAAVRLADGNGRRIGLRSGTEADARVLLVHCAEEMQHLASFLPALYAQFSEQD